MVNRNLAFAVALIAVASANCAAVAFVAVAIVAVAFVVAFVGIVFVASLVHNYRLAESVGWVGYFHFVVVIVKI